MALRAADAALLSRAALCRALIFSENANFALNQMQAGNYYKITKNWASLSTGAISEKPE